MTKVIIEDAAFIGILTTVFEVYDNEAYGILIGYKRKKHYVVTRAIPYQTATRYKDGIDVVVKREKLLANVINLLTKRGIIGDFHSHTRYNFCLSDTDINDMIASGEGIYLLSKVDKTDKRKKWVFDKREKVLKGSIWDEFFVQIKVFEHKHGSKRMKKLNLECPYIKVLNKRLFGRI
jgi:proteasome lid subunit RPN8/RPN11